MKKMSHKLIAFICGLYVSGAVFALATDKDQPIFIEADQAEIDDERGVTIYRGDATITQGSLKINGNVVTIHFDANQDITKVVAKGRPAKFKQKPDGGKPNQNAEARVMEFHTNNDTIILLGDAISWQGENKISADRIVYNTLQGKVIAESLDEDGGDASSGRVSITIAPKKK